MTEPDADTATVASRRAAAQAMRRQILGHEYVDSAIVDPAPGAVAMQQFVLDSAWSVWTRGGLAPRDRSLAVLAMTAALGRMDEFTLHARSAPRAGVTDEEIDELVLQIAAYCGAPAGVSARRVIASIRREQD
jgi:4-carboxymuconolactone decarboxylase